MIVLSSMALSASALTVLPAAAEAPALAATAAALAEDPLEVETPSCGCQDSGARNRTLGGAASLAMGIAGLILAIRGYRNRSRLPREDRKFGDYRGPKKG